MRRQYHSQEVAGQVLIWDVHRLVQLTAGLPIIEVAISAIREFEENYWFEGETPTCKEVALHARLILDTDLKYPIILSARGRLMDGMHRVCKAYLCGRQSIEAVQFIDDPKADYIDVDIGTLPYDEP